jgi:exopolysaccharide production protein ExoZ
MTSLIVRRQRYFLVNRILRIYPGFMIAVILVVFLKVLFFSSIIQNSLIKTMTLLPFGVLDYPLSIEWSLIFEVVFYLICSVLIIVRPNKFFLASFFTAWILLICVTPSFALLHSTTLELIQSSWNLGFCTGGLMYLIFNCTDSKFIPSEINRHISYSTLFVFLSITFFVNFLGIAWQLLACLSYSFSIAILSRTVELGKIGKLFALIGDWSYGIYLLHVGLLTIMVSFVDQRNLSAVFVVLIPIIALFFACCYGYFESKIHVKLSSQAYRVFK